MALTAEALAALSMNDVEYRYLGAIGATGLHLDDRRLEMYGENEHAYFAAVSGLTPAQAFMLPDHRYAYYKANVAPQDRNGTLADLARSFWAQWAS